MRGATSLVQFAFALTVLFRSGPSLAQVPSPAGSVSLGTDPRLSAKRSLRALTTPLRDILADLSRQTGIDFYADEGVMNDPITVITHDRPLADLLDRIARLAGYEWTRHGEGKLSSYTLRLSDKRKSEQQAAEKARLLAAADRIRKENEEYFKLSSLSEARRQEIASEIPGRLAAETDTDRAQQLRFMHGVLSELSDGSSRRHWTPTIRALIHSLSAEDISSALKGGTIYYAWPQLPACRSFPEETLRDLQQVARLDLGLSGGFRGEIVSLRLRIVGLTARMPYLNWHLTVGQRASNFQSTAGYTASIPSPWAVGMSSALPRSAEGPPSWTNNAAMNSRLSLRLPSAPANSRLSAQTPAYRIGDVLGAMDDALPINVVSDGFWSGHLLGFEARDAPLGEVMDRLARLTNRIWRPDGDFIMINSRDAHAEHAAEPPAIVVRRWADEANDGLFGLDELSEIAALPDPQLSTLHDMANRGAFPVLYSPLSSGRSHLRLWSSLTATQRRKALTSGLAYRDLDPATQMKFVLAATDPAARQLTDIPVDEASLIGSSMRAIQRETAYWGVRKRGAVSTARVDRTDSENQPISREEALKRFRALDDSIRLEEVLPMIKVGVTFSYETNRSALAISYIDLPPRWGG